MGAFLPRFGVPEVLRVVLNSKRGVEIAMNAAGRLCVPVPEGRRGSHQTHTCDARALDLTSLSSRRM